MVITILLFFVLYMLDQITKYLSQIMLSEGTTVKAIPYLLNLNLDYNKGMAWSKFSDMPWLLVAISAVASIILGFFCMKNDWKRAKLASASLTMAFAGCVGNLFDRAIMCIPELSKGRPGVVDMIDFEPFNALCDLFHLNHAIFNLADAFLVVGLILYAIDLLFFADKRSKKYAKENYNR